MKNSIKLILCGLLIGKVMAAEPIETPDMEIPAPTPAEVPVSDKPFADWLGNRAPSELFRVMPGETPAHLRYAPEYIDQYEVIGTGPVAIPENVQVTLKKAFQNNAAFGPLRIDRCKFRPGLSVRAGEGTDRMDFLICFACDEIGVVPMGQPLQALYSFDQPTREILLNMAKQLLPNDEAIQELPAIRRDKAAPPPPAPALPEPATE